MILTEKLRQRLVTALQRLEFLADEMEPVEGATLAEMSQEAHQLILELQETRTVPEPVKPVKLPVDPRILRQVGKLRLVAPAARISDSGTRTRYLNGKLVIERQGQDSIGSECWAAAQVLEWGLVSERHVFRMLAGDGWDDRELREYDK